MTKFEEHLREENKMLLAACDRAELARQSLARNAVFIKSALRKEGVDSSWLDGVIRGLEHAKSAIAKAELSMTCEELLKRNMA